MSWRITPSCTVRRCGESLHWGERALQCVRGHLFDVARSGYCNLLQPQDRSSPNPGDSRQAVKARSRTLQRGLGDALIGEIETQMAALTPAAGSTVLDVGCGEGTILGRVAARFELEAWGVDISTAAADAAARAHPALRWVVANADRRIPFPDRCFDWILSITAAKNPAEFRRLLSSAGRLIVAVPDDDDLIELRAAVLGKADQLDRASSLRARFDAAFELEDQSHAKVTAELDPGALRDLLIGTYRGARHREQHNVEQLGRMRVTLSHRVLRLRPRD